MGDAGPGSQARLMTGLSMSGFLTKFVRCNACAAVGYIDEADAERLGADLGDARTEMCSWCGGDGVVEVDDHFALAVFGITVAFAVWVAFSVAAEMVSCLGLGVCQ